MIVKDILREVQRDLTDVEESNQAKKISQEPTTKV